MLLMTQETPILQHNSLEVAGDHTPANRPV